MQWRAGLFQNCARAMTDLEAAIKGLEALGRLLAASAAASDETLRPREAAALAGLSYDAFRRRSEYLPARVSPAGARPRYSRNRLLKIRDRLTGSA
jgi:hypothetical protein